MILWAVERKARAHTWLYVTAGLRDDSRKARQRQRADVSKTKPQRKRAGADVPIRARKGIITIPAQNARVGGVVQAAAALLSSTAAYKTAVKVDSAFARFWWILRGGLAHYHLDKSLRPPLDIAKS